jgi:hypothetical protein
VTVEHRGWSTLRDGHPARHGRSVAAATEMVGRWWGELLMEMRSRAHDRMQT